MLINKSPETPKTKENRKGFHEKMKLIRESSNKKIKTSTADLYTKILGKVEKYLDSACTTDMNPLEYWEMASRGGDPIDIKMCELALHYLTPPASSVDIERLFSTAADITTNDRNRINPEKAEKVLFCHENLHQINYQY